MAGLTSLMLAMAFGGLAVFGGVVAFREGSTTFALGTDPQGQVEALASGALWPAFSWVSREEVLDECAGVLPALIAEVQPTSVRSRLFQRCEEIASDITATTPHGYAWLIRGLVAELEDRTNDFNEAITRSQQIAPNEGWLAESRVTLAMSQEQKLDRPASVAYESDIALLISGGSNLGSIAAHYVEDEGFRARTMRIVEALPESAQRRFVSAVKKSLPEAVVR